MEEEQPRHYPMQRLHSHAQFPRQHRSTAPHQTHNSLLDLSYDIPTRTSNRTSNRMETATSTNNITNSTTAKTTSTTSIKFNNSNNKINHKRFDSVPELLTQSNTRVVDETARNRDIMIERSTPTGIYDHFNSNNNKDTKSSGNNANGSKTRSIGSRSDLLTSSTASTLQQSHSRNKDYLHQQISTQPNHNFQRQAMYRAQQVLDVGPDKRIFHNLESVEKEERDETKREQFVKPRQYRNVQGRIKTQPKLSFTPISGIPIATRSFVLTPSAPLKFDHEHMRPASDITDSFL
eukprot:m.62597 g.62597  ORF g.62597 m.62597 type:complete len:292 (+) comp11409_c0_seq2:92-967(+)